MFDIGWTEILILAVISLFVIGPKDIPKFLGYIGKIIGKVRGITSEFRETVDDAIRNSELEEVRKEISFTDPELSKNFNQVLNPMKNTAENEKHSGIDNDNKEQMTPNVDKSTVKKNNKEEVSQNYEFAGPTEKLPSGLKHIRENSSEKDKPKSNKDEA